MQLASIGYLRRLFARVITVVPLVATTLVPLPVTPSVAAAPPTCQFMSPTGTPSAIKRVIHIQFDNVHFRRDNPDVPSDLEQMPHLLSFIKQNGTLVGNDHTPLIAHTADDLVTALTGVYGDQHGLPISNSFEVYNNSTVGSYNTSAFTYWTDTLPRPNKDGGQPVEIIDGNRNNLQAPWVPFVKAGCNFGAVSTADLELEGNNDIIQVFGANSPEAAEVKANSDQAFSDFIGVTVHCADLTCSTVGNGSGARAKPELGGQGFGALYGHKYVATQVSPITETDGTPITGFTEGFDPTPSYTLGYLLSLLDANVPVVYGYIADAHDSRNDCDPTTATSPVKADTAGGLPCGAYAPGEPGYVAQLKQWDTGFAQFFAKLGAHGINASNTLFEFSSDENDHYAGTPPLNEGCDGVTTPCKYDRTRLGEVTTNLPLLLQQQNLYQSTDLPYGIDFDSAPGFWLKGHPAVGTADVRKLEGALAAVKFFNPYTNGNQRLFRFLLDDPGLKAMHMLTSDPDRNAGVVGFGQENNFINIFSLIFKGTSSCNNFPSATAATCLNNGFIWIHGDFADDINHTWVALVGPGVLNKGVDNATWADHTDVRPTLMSLLCLSDGYTHEGRVLLEDLKNSALPDSVADARGTLESLGRTFKQINAPVGEFGRAAIHLSTAAIKSSDAEYASKEAQLGNLVAQRDQLAARIETQLDKLAGCGGITTDRETLNQLNREGAQWLAQVAGDDDQGDGDISD